MPWNLRSCCHSPGAKRLAHLRRAGTSESVNLGLRSLKLAYPRLTSLQPSGLLSPRRRRARKLAWRAQAIASHARLIVFHKTALRQECEEPNLTCRFYE